MAREADVLEALLSSRPAAERSRLLPGEDAAVVPAGRGELVTTTDALEENVHFRAGWLEVEDLAWKLLAVNLSDLAAAGAEPVGYLLALAWPASLPVDDAARLGAALREAEERWSCPLLGGDTDVGPGPLRLSATAFGRRSRAVSRGAGRAGDLVFVTGALGGAAAVVARRLGGADLPDDAAWRDAARRFARPEPRLDVARALGATMRAAIDISDGLRHDALTLANASGLALDLDLDRAPVHVVATREQALDGGEDYELVVAGPPDLRSLVPELLAVGRLRDKS